MKKKNSSSWAQRFPEFVLPLEGELVTSMRVHDASGRSRIAYIRDAKNGYPFSSEVRCEDMHRLMDGRQEQE